jgi:hypothetical protein
MFLPLTLNKGDHMTKTAGIMVISLFAFGLCVAPFAIAARLNTIR